MVSDVKDNLMRLLSEYQEANKEAALITVTSADGINNCNVGAMMLVNEQGEVISGGFGNEIIQNKAAEQGKICIDRGLSRKVLISTDGGDVEVFINAFFNQDNLLLVGAGAVASNIYRIASVLGYRITVVDNRPDMLTKERFAGARELILGDIVSSLKKYPITPNTYIVIATHHHEFDEQSLQAVISAPAAYIGVIGNKRKVAHYFDNLREMGISDEVINKVYSPIGLNLGGKKTAEIALSIMAEIQAVKFNRIDRSIGKRDI